MQINSLSDLRKAVEADTEGRWNALGVLDAVDRLTSAPTVAAQQCGQSGAIDAFRNALELPRWYSDDELLSAIRSYLEAATPPDVAGTVDKAIVEAIGALRIEQPGRAYDILSDALEAATALRLSAGGGWRDAGSVPEDGSVILAYRPDAGVFTAHYVEEDAHLSSLANPPEGDCYWFTTNGDDLTGDMFTHWQPLPVPPTAPAEGA